MPHDLNILISKFVASTYLALLLLLPLAAGTSSGDNKCFQRLDIVLIVDATSSATAAEFLQTTSVVKEIASKFLVGQRETRLALMSFSQSAQIVANFADINSLADFNAAVDKLKMASGRPSISTALQTAQSSVLNHARQSRSSVLLILVRDGRYKGPGADSAELTLIKAEAAAVKAARVAIHAVASGGSWNVKELEALFGSDHALFLSQKRATESVKSLNNRICSNCEGQLVRAGLCLGNWSLAQKVTKFETLDAAGSDVCRKEIHWQVEKCNKSDTCTKFDRSIGTCEPGGKLAITNSWKYFSSRNQSCLTSKVVARVPCDDATKCPSQTADVILLLEKSHSIRENFSTVKEVAKSMVRSFEIGQTRVRVGLVVFHSRVRTLASLPLDLSKAELLSIIDGISTQRSDFGFTRTYMGLDIAKDMFRGNSRPNVGKFLVIITDGKSDIPARTFQSTATLKKLGVTVLAIGVGNLEYYRSELNTMTAPESGTNLLILKDFNELKSLTSRITARLCLQMELPNPTLCQENVTLHSISECTHRMQQVTHIEYRFDSGNRCFKQMQTTSSGTCKKVCTDPVDGKQYAEGDTWTNSCQRFVCDSTNLLQTLPAKECMAADNTCRAVNSAPFRCRDEKDKEVDNCRCELKNGVAVLTIVRIF